MKLDCFVVLESDSAIETRIHDLDIFKNVVEDGNRESHGTRL